MTTGYNEAQSLALAVVPKVTGFLSVFFSALIVVTVIRDDKKRNKIYHRLLLGISLTDITSSFCFALSTWPIPRDSMVLWASGNETTCNVQGFFSQFAIASSFYNASLSLYFLLVIRYGWKEERLRKIEPILHAIPLLYGFGSAFGALGLGLYRDATLWCAIAPQRDAYRLALFYGPLWTAIILVTIFSTMIYLHVSHAEKRTKHYKYNFEAPAIGPAKSSSADVDDGCVTADASSTLTSCKRELVLDALSESKELAGGTDLNSDDEGQLEGVGRVPSIAKGSLTQPTPSASQIISNARTNPSRGFVASLVRRLSSLSIRDNKVLLAAVHRKRSREVASQCFWFAGAFYINWTALSLTRVIQAINGEVYFSLLLIAAFTAPMHGLPNVIVYLRPKVRQLRQDSTISLWQVLKNALAQERSSLPVAGSIDDDPL